MVKRGCGGRMLTAVVALCLAAGPEVNVAMAAPQSSTDAAAPSATQPDTESPAGQNSGAGGTPQKTASPDNTGQLPDSPGATRAQSSPPPAPPISSRGTPNDIQKPSGTAAAEVGNVTGVAASMPAGVAIAPAKQRRVRSLLIKIGAVVGAGVAIGTVYALSQASPSTPPGAR